MNCTSPGSVLKVPIGICTKQGSPDFQHHLLGYEVQLAFQSVRNLYLVIPIIDFNSTSYFLRQVGLLVNLDINIFFFGGNFIHRNCFLYCSLHQRKNLVFCNAQSNSWHKHWRTSPFRSTWYRVVSFATLLSLCVASFSRSVMKSSLALRTLGLA